MSRVPPAAELALRLHRFRGVLHKRGVPAAFITDEQNVRYLSGFTGSDSALLVTDSRRYLCTDFRYIEEAARTAPGWKIVLEPPGLMDKAGAILHKLRLRTCAVEPGDLRLTDFAGLKKAARGVKLRQEHSMVCELRLAKSPWEVAQIEKALRIQEAAFLQLCGELKPGIREREAAARLRFLMVQGGADDQAFDVMFQAGSHSSLPHGRPTDRALQADAIVLVDWGARCGGYHSDLTRTFFFGTIPPRLREIHGIVMDAQAAAIARIAPNVAMADVDKAARDVIGRAGYKKAFGHSTGHGLGLNIHEAPSLSSRQKGVLRAGMVVTVEPGIYLPGLGGVRIEDDVLVTARGGRVLSRLQKGLRWTGENE